MRIIPSRSILATLAAAAVLATGFGQLATAAPTPSKPSATATPSKTPTRKATPSRTPSSSPTSSPSATASPTPSATPSRSATPRAQFAATATAPTSLHAPAYVIVTGGTPGTTVEASAGSNPQAQAQTTGSATVAADGTARVTLPVPADGWAPGVTYHWGVSQTTGTGSASGSFTVQGRPSHVDKTLDGDFDVPSHPDASVPVSITGGEPGTRVTVTITAIGGDSSTTAHGTVDSDGTVTVQVPPVKGGWRLNQRYGVVIANESARVDLGGFIVYRWGGEVTRDRKNIDHEGGLADTGTRI